MALSVRKVSCFANSQPNESSTARFYCVDDFSDFDIDIIRRDLTFVRIVIDSIQVNDDDNFIANLIQSRALYGFILEYQFPFFDCCSKSSRSCVQASAKNYTNSLINFRHRKIFKLRPDRKLWSLWSQCSLLISLSAQLNTLGKFSKKLIGRCELSLRNLLCVPFSIYHNYAFTGNNFLGFSFIRVELGSHIKSLMERLEILREPFLEDVIKERKSKSLERRSSRSELQDRSSVPSTFSPLRFRSNSVSRSTNDVLSPLSSRCSPAASPMNYHHLNFQDAFKYSFAPTYYVNLIVYSARRLPVSSLQGELLPPTTYVSVIANDGRILCSQTCTSFEPKFHWSETFEVSEKRQNLVVKLWNKISNVSDKVIGFVSIPLPPHENDCIEYEMSNLMTSLESPLITISLASTNKTSSSGNSYSNQIHLPDTAPSIFLSKEEVSEKLRKNLTELEQLMADLKQ